jgi:hypothetical protein
MKIARSLTLILTFGSSVLLRADPITNLFDTGVDSSGNVTTGTDTHWTTSEAATAPGALAGPFQSAQIGDLAWPGLGGTTSAWIYDNTNNGADGYFDYQTTFTVTPGDQSTASISGGYAVDNELINVFLNGVSLGISDGFPGEGLGGFLGFTPFTIPVGSDFVAGTNTLLFETFNDGGPSGFQAQLSGTEFGSAPDASSTGCLLGVALLIFAVSRRKLANA